MKEHIFYSWQSDSFSNTNRNFIKDALERSVKAINKDDTVDIDAVVDRDTLNVPGSPDISETIFAKINQASIFVCDISFIDPDASRKTPNPNVLFELGYAVKALGWSRIILVMNTEYGDPSDLPFDIRPKRTMTYKVNTNAESKSEARNSLIKQLTYALTLIFQKDGKRAFQTSVNKDPQEYKDIQLKISRRIISLLTESSPRTSEVLIEVITSKGRFEEFDVEDAIDTLVQHEVLGNSVLGGYKLNGSHDFYFRNKVLPALVE